MVFINSKYFLIFLICFSLTVPNVYAFDVGSLIDAGVDLLTGNPVGFAVNIISAVKDEVIEYARNFIFGTDGVVGGTDEESEKNITQEEFESNDDTAAKLANGVLFNSTSEANSDIIALRKLVEADTVEYTLDERGSTGTVRLSLYGKNKIYGYSVFPVKLNVKTFDNPDRPDPTHITDVEIKVNGNLWKRTWEGDWKTEGGDFDFYALLKTPDGHAGNVRRYLSGNIDKGIDDIIHSEVDDFEVNVKVKGYKEIWVYEEDDDGDGGEWVHVRDSYFTVTATTTNLANAVADGYYNVGGFEGSFPSSFVEYREKWTPINIVAQGSSSNLLMRVWSNPVHVLNSDVGIDGFLLGNTGYLDLYGNEDIEDGEYRIVSVRVDGDGDYTVANSVNGVIASFDDVQKIGTTIVYNGDNNTVGFRNYLIVYGIITRDDGVELPVWVVSRMKTTVVSDYRSLVGDTIEDVKDILSDDEIDVMEKVELENKLDSVHDSMEDKVSSSETWITKSEMIGDDNAKEYALKAKECYEKAREALSKINLNDVDSVRAGMKKAKELELAGDYYLEASKKTYVGLSDEAEALSKNAETLEESHSGGLLIFGDGGLLSNIDDTIQGIPGGWVTVIVGVVVLIVLLGSGGSKGSYYFRRKY